VLVLATAGEWFLAAVYGEDQVSCGIATLPVPLPDLPEASGITHSTAGSDLFWTFNDSGTPTLFGIDSNGDVKARVGVTNARVGNWEDISSGPCHNAGPAAHRARGCLYIADIGDNDAQRESIRVYRVAEPSPADRATQPVEVFDGKYPDGPHDAEAAFVLPDGGLYVITKDKYSRVYRFPLRPGAMATLERAAVLPLNNVTDADASPDGARVAVRTKEDVVFYRAAELLAGDVEHGDAVNTADVGEPQGVGVAFGPANTVVLAGEGGGRKQLARPGTLAALQCQFASPKGRKN
jgi:hypothetical protein